MSEPFPLEEFYQTSSQGIVKVLELDKDSLDYMMIKNRIDEALTGYTQISIARSLHILAQQKQGKVDILEALKCPKCKHLPTFVISYNDQKDDNFFRFYCNTSGCSHIFGSPYYQLFDALKSWIDVISKANSGEVKA